jgi:hypothetical protein
MVARGRWRSAGVEDENRFYHRLAPQQWTM